MTVKTTYLKNYQKPTFDITSIELQFDIFDDYTFITSELDIIAKDKQPIFLNGKELILQSIEMNGTALEESCYTWNKDDLCIIKFHCFS